MSEQSVIMMPVVIMLLEQLEQHFPYPIVDCLLVKINSRIFGASDGDFALQCYILFVYDALYQH